MAVVTIPLGISAFSHVALVLTFSVFLIRAVDFKLKKNALLLWRNPFFKP